MSTYPRVFDTLEAVFKGVQPGSFVFSHSLGLRLAPESLLLGLVVEDDEEDDDSDENE